MPQSIIVFKVALMGQKEHLAENRHERKPYA